MLHCDVMGGVHTLCILFAQLPNLSPLLRLHYSFSVLASKRAILFAVFPSFIAILWKHRGCSLPTGAFCLYPSLYPCSTRLVFRMSALAFQSTASQSRQFNQSLCILFDAHFHNMVQRMQEDSHVIQLNAKTTRRSELEFSGVSARH